MVVKIFGSLLKIDIVCYVDHPTNFYFTTLNVLTWQM